MKYTKQFEQYWRRCAVNGFEKAPERVRACVKQVAFRAWQAARRGLRAKPVSF